MATDESALRVRWLGRVTYDDALALQRRLHRYSRNNYLLLLEHPHVVTLGRRGSRQHLLVDVEALGGSVVETDRGGEVTYHGPGQLVGYPILTVPGRRGGGMADTAAYVAGIEDMLIKVLADLGLQAGCLDRHTGVWVDHDGLRPRKIAAIGVRLSRARSMHGFALNVDPDLSWFSRIVPCGITSLGVTSLAAEGIDVSMREVVDHLVKQASLAWGAGSGIDRADVAHRVMPDDLARFTREAAGNLDISDVETASEEKPLAEPEVEVEIKPEVKPEPEPVSPRLLGRLAEVQLQDTRHEPVPLRSRKPEWMRVPLNTGSTFHEVRSTLRDLDLVTVCEEAGCPNISECWNDGTATFMILGERCTRACGFCLVDTRRPEPPDATEPQRVAEAAARMKLEYAVVTMVARDDLTDGGAEAVVATVAALRQRLPGIRVETLISDLRGDPVALQTVFDCQPDVLNHNIETVARLQRAVRPSASYARSLSVLARAATAGLTTKSSIIAGMGETHEEMVQTLVDLHAAGTDIVTIGQYLRPSAKHLPVDRWWPPEAFTRWKEIGESLGISHVEASPLTRSSYHARTAADATSKSETDSDAVTAALKVAVT